MKDPRRLVDVIQQDDKVHDTLEEVYVQPLGDEDIVEPPQLSLRRELANAELAAQTYDPVVQVSPETTVSTPAESARHEVVREEVAHYPPETPLTCHLSCLRFPPVKDLPYFDRHTPPLLRYFRTGPPCISP